MGDLTALDPLMAHKEKLRPKKALGMGILERSEQVTVWKNRPEYPRFDWEIPSSVSQGRRHRALQLYTRSRRSSNYSGFQFPSRPCQCLKPAHFEVTSGCWNWLKQMNFGKEMSIHWLGHRQGHPSDLSWTLRSPVLIGVRAATIERDQEIPYHLDERSLFGKHQLQDGFHLMLYFRWCQLALLMRWSVSNWICLRKSNSYQK